MKRIIFTFVAVLALTMTGAAFAQGPNTTAPGPTTQQEPALTNNNMPNPGNPVAKPQTETTGVLPETEQGTGVDVDVDTGARAEGALDVDVTPTTDADTDASGSTSTGYADSDSLPSTASELPSVALIGLLALGAAFAVRSYAKRNA